MKRGVSFAAIAAIAASLAACDNTGESMAANGKICTNWKTAPASGATTAGVAGNPATAQPGVVTTAGDAAGPTDECVKRWAYSLASSRDGADVVADAAVAACATALTAWNQTAMGVSGAGGSDQGVSAVTGQPTNALAEHANFAHSEALLYVVEARAGRCKPPAVVNGLPVGA